MKNGKYKMKTNIFKVAFIFILLVNIKIKAQVFPNLNVNVPVNSSVANFGFNLIGFCSMTSSSDYFVITTPTNGGLTPVASGVTLQYKITAINVSGPANLTCAQTGTTPVNVGDTYTFTNASPLYQFSCILSATVAGQFMLVGTPTVLNQPYECGYQLSVTLANCGNTAQLIGNSIAVPPSSPCNVGISNSINELSIETKINISPNPNNGEFNLQLNTINENTNIEIYNTIGQLILKQPIEKLSNNVNLNNAVNGIYFIQIKENNKLIGITKIVKE